ncbi:MAG: RNase adapter RapZ [Alphaproteobacteria bacterium]|nr:RNase adapter RapZ [Alphaproteobacteria bacterium]NDG04667.1 RNase adapter RapZ [Alphaproteobacteria bacterium]
MKRKDKPAEQQPVVLLTGMSGAGLSTALKALEDLGYEAVDNLRLSLIAELVQQSHAEKRPIAIGVDTRNADFSADNLILNYRKLTSNINLAVKLVFLECADDALQQRFSETRRRHPLAADGSVLEAIREERTMMDQVREVADLVIDTSLLTIHDLRRLVTGHFRMDQDSGLNLYIMSFGFKNGIPREADMVFDVRFLQNPHWQSELRALTGHDPQVATFVQQDISYEPFMQGLAAWLVPLLPRYVQEGKSYLTIAVGCTGGRHRSVLVSEQLGSTIAAHGYIVGIGHRDLE